MSTSKKLSMDPYLLATSTQQKYDPENGEYLNDKIIEDRKLEAQADAQLKQQREAAEKSERNQKLYEHMV